MGFFDIFKRSRREVNRANQAQGKAGEEQVKAKYEFNGYKVTRTGKGHDYRATKKNWFTGKKETKYVEVKTGNSKLSPLQRKKKKQLGSKYVEERVNSNPFMGNNSNSLFGSSQSTRKKKKSSNEGIFDNVFGSSSSTKPRKSKSSSYDSLWGSSSSTKPRKSKSSSYDSLWGSAPKKRKSKRKSDSIW